MKPTFSPAPDHVRQAFVDRREGKQRTLSDYRADYSGKVDR